MATGLLMLVVGKATKLQDKLMCEHKEYAGTLMLGVETSSQDAMGEIVAEYSVDGVTEQAVREAFDRFDGAFEQIPPMVSAIKKDGVPLYKLARKGQEIVREPRPVEVFGHGISRVAIPEVDFTVQCSKGFYVRSYAYDIGKALGCGAHLSALRRTRSGSFTLDRAITVDTLKTAPREELFRAMLSLKELADILIARLASMSRKSLLGNFFVPPAGGSDCRGRGLAFWPRQGGECRNPCACCPAATGSG